MGEFKRYEKYKDSGVEWIGEVPEHWKIFKLKNNCFFQEGPGLRNWQFTDEGVKVICVTNITESGINFNNFSKCISEEEYLSTYKHFTVNKGDLLLSSSGASWGKVAEFESDETVILNTSTIRINENSGKNILKIYLKFLLQSEIVRKQLEILMTGSCQPNFGPSHLGKVIVPFPEIEEQKKIAFFLYRKTSEIDSLIADKEKLIELLQEQRQAIISEAVTKGLDKNVKMKDSGIEWIGEVPEGWESSKIKYIADINARTLNEAVDEDYEITYLDISNVNSNGEILNTQIYRFKDAPSRARRIIINGDTIVSTVRTYLQTIAWIPKAEENLICSTGFAVLSPKNKILPEYLAYLLRSTKYIDEIVARSVGVSYPAINASDIGNLECFIPTLEEQSEIISFINEQVIDIVNLVEDLNIQIEKLNEYRQSLISEAVTGKIMV